MSATGGVIVLSSSPPRFFAPSPTPADNTWSSPAFPSPAAIFASQRSQDIQNFDSSQPTVINWPAACDKLKTARTTRQGLEDGRPGCKALLLQRSRSKENIHLVKRSAILEAGKGDLDKHEVERLLSLARVPYLAHGKGTLGTESQQHAQNQSRRGKGPQSPSLEDPLPTALDPLPPNKVSSRRLNWTPPATATRHLPAEPVTLSVSRGLLGSFGCKPALHGQKAATTAEAAGDGGPTKRRKLEIVETGIIAPKNAMDIPGISNVASKPTTAPSKFRNKSPKKKHTTITGLATSLYVGEDRVEPSPMMQYLSATQQRAQASDSDSVADTAKRKKVVRKPKKIRKKSCKSVLLSPQTAMKTFENQDVLFGSASQLAREESPTLIRDTVQTIRQSENVLLMSDPASTQTTIPPSGSAQTPSRSDRRGVSRFLNSRNMWGVADRDDDNALLQVDTLDMFDSPDIRAAFAGKDVLLEPAAPRLRDSESPEKADAEKQKLIKTMDDDVQPSPGFRGGQLERQDGEKGFVDIDELGIKTPCARLPSKAPLQVRAFHTAAAPKRGSTCTGTTAKTTPTGRVRAASSAPTRPSFNGYTTAQLASQLTAYGFKPIKKREKMIGVLDRCWDDKNRPRSDLVTAVDSSLGKTAEMSHGDFLSKVHDISARPVPKVHKPRGRPKKDQAVSVEELTVEMSPTKGFPMATDAPEKASLPKKRKGPVAAAGTRTKKLKDAVGAPIRSKLSTKSTKSAPSNQEVVDIDELEDDDRSVDQEMTEAYTDTTGVKPAARWRHPSLPATWPSSDAFEPPSWMEETPKASTGWSKPTKASKPARATAIENPKTSTARSKPTKKTTAAKATGLETPLSDLKAVTSTHTSNANATTTIITSHSPLTTSSPSTLVPTTSLPSLPNQITLAITTYQPQPQPQHVSTTHNSQTNPTMYQKILMYDPIVLEDLAAWLNTEGFRRIGEDREVGAMEVREWCEARGVCCLWRGGGGWRGKL